MVRINNGNAVRVLRPEHRECLRAIFDNGEVDKLILKKKTVYEKAVRGLLPLVDLGVSLQAIGEMVGMLTKGDKDINKRLIGRGLGIFSQDADRIRDFFGMRVVEDP
jgi:hypothetical protein